MSKKYSQEFMEEVLAESKKYLPKWLWASLVQAARPRAGGRSAHRIDEPDVFAKLALGEIKPKKLKDISDEDLDVVWLRLNQWHANAKRRKQPVENIVNAALWVRQERERRGKKTDGGNLVEEVEALDKAECGPPKFEDKNLSDEEQEKLKEVHKQLVPEVPTVGPKHAKVVFVGASPSKIEAARRESFAGQVGETFNQVYLKALGLKRSEVLLINAVPMPLEDDEGKPREPMVDEINKWQGWLNKELKMYQPEIVVALGRVAESALNEYPPDVVLPHPGAVKRFGDSGEVSRKLKQLRVKIKKQRTFKQQAEGGTRSIAAFDHWNKDWIKALPKSGKGKFVYQHHWRGLDEDETKLDDKQLLDTSHSIHGDIRLSGNDGLWGFAVLLGRAEDNRKLEHGDKLIDWKEGDSIELAPKLQQPEEWLKVGVGKPLVTGPGEAGATSQKSSKFFALDKGTYQMGVAKKHAVEIFLDGEHLKGRYLFLFAPVGGRRRWLIDKPEDQTPWAESRDLADVISELKKKRQRWLYWSKPGSSPEVYDVRTGNIVSKSVPIAKADPVKRIVYGVVIDPYGRNGPEEDAHADWTPPKEVEQMAHGYLTGSREVKLQHKDSTKAQVVESWVEQYPSRNDYLKAVRGEPHRVYRRKFGSDKIHSGSWLVGVKLTEDLWKLYKAGKITAFSPGGFGFRRRMLRSEMPQVIFVELVERAA